DRGPGGSGHVGDASYHLRGTVLMVDGHGDGVAAFFAVGVRTTDAEGGPGQCDRARRGGAAIAPIDTGAVVAADAGGQRVAGIRFGSTRIGEGRLPKTKGLALGGCPEGGATESYHSRIGHIG